MAKLKLDLHPIFNDTRRIEAALAAIIAEAEEKRIEEVEIIPGKGSGALKKTVIRFLERPDVKARYHRIVKDSDNWGRLFVYFKWGEPVRKPVPSIVTPPASYTCFCCCAANRTDLEILFEGPSIVECPACGSPNRLTARRSGSGWRVEAESGYEDGAMVSV